MRVSRIYTAVDLLSGANIVLDDDNAHYVRTVLRLKSTAAVIVFNGRGGEFAGTLTEVSRKAVVVNLGEHHARSVESPLHICLGLGIARGDRMDLVVQKAVELGVNTLMPLVTSRCVVDVKGDKRQQRILHWQKIVQHAAEQCGRTELPLLTEIANLPEWLDGQQGLKLFLDPYSDTSLHTLSPQDARVTLLTGPEGGFTAEERETAKQAGFIPVRLGQRILRTETASLAALSAVQMLWGDFQ